jgi:hypothetical protein
MRRNAATGASRRPFVGRVQPSVVWSRLPVGIAADPAFVYPYTPGNPGTSKETDMNRKLRLLIAVAVGVAILRSVAADAGERGSGITRNEAQRLRYQVHQLHRMQRIAGSDGTISRAENARLTHKQQQIRRMIQAAKTN